MLAEASPVNARRSDVSWSWKKLTTATMAQSAPFANSVHTEATLSQISADFSGSQSHLFSELGHTGLAGSESYPSRLIGWTCEAQS